MSSTFLMQKKEKKSVTTHLICYPEGYNLFVMRWKSTKMCFLGVTVNDDHYNGEPM